MSHLQLYAFRLLPGQDLKQEIQRFVTDRHIRAGWVNTCVGSLQTFAIRFANQSVPASSSGYFEILGLSGTLSLHGSHLHIMISDGDGKTMGGHLVDGCVIYTTAEIVISASDDFEFTRVKDRSTEWNELHIMNRV